MKQNVSGPVAAIAIMLVLIAGVFWSQFTHKQAKEEVFVLPFEPKVEQAELQMLHRSLQPLGLACVMPPVSSDRFKGARVALVAPGSPAANSGLRPGDLITRFSDRQVTHPFSIIWALEQAPANKPSTVVVTRDGKEQKLVIAGLKSISPEERLR